MSEEKPSGQPAEADKAASASAAPQSSGPGAADGEALEAAWHAAGAAAQPDALAPSSGVDGIDADFDEVDPELLKLSKPRRRRHPIISVVVIGFSLFLIARSWTEFAYFFVGRTPTELGDSTALTQSSPLKENSYVALNGPPVRKHALLIRGRVSGYYRFFLLRGAQLQIFAQHHDTQRTNERAIVGRHVGRLVRFGTLSYRNGVRDYFSRSTSISHDFDFKALAALGPRGGSLADSAGIEATITPKTVLWINAVHDQEWIAQFSKHAYPKEADAARLLRQHAPIFAPEEHNSGMYHRFVLKLSRSAAQALMKALAPRKLHAGVMPRQVGYTARWDQLKFEGETLVLSAKDAGFPKRYTLFGAEPQALLRPVAAQPVRLLRSELRYVSSSSKFTISDNAWVILAGETPADKWLFVALYGLLLAFIVFNGAALYLRFKRR